MIVVCQCTVVTQIQDHNCYKFGITLYSTQFGQVMIGLAQNSHNITKIGGLRLVGEEKGLGSICILFFFFLKLWHWTAFLSMPL